MSSLLLHVGIHTFYTICRPRASPTRWKDPAQRAVLLGLQPRAARPTARSRPTALNARRARQTCADRISLLEATHLIFCLQPFGYGKDVLRGKAKVYLADPSLAPAVMLRGPELLGSPAQLALVVENAIVKHMMALAPDRALRLSYWRGPRDREVDLVIEAGRDVMPIEVKYRRQPTNVRRLGGLKAFCGQHSPARGYVVTLDPSDAGPLPASFAETSVVRIPAVAWCWWAGASEHRGRDRPFV